MKPRFESTDRWAQTRLGSAGLVGFGGLVLAALGRWDRVRHPAVRSWAATVRRFLRMDVELSGLEHIDPAERYVVAPLHEGFADALVLLRLPLDLRFTVRDELLGWRHLGPYLRRSRQLVIPDSSSRSALRQLYQGTQEAFAADESLVVFPQGSILGIETAFQPGAFRLAAHFDRPLLPVVITGTHRVWEHPFSSTLRYGVRVCVRVLPPIPGSEAVQQARRLERRMKAAVFEVGMAAPRRFDPRRDGWWDDYHYQIDPDFTELAQFASC